MTPLEQAARALAQAYIAHGSDRTFVGDYAATRAVLEQVSAWMKDEPGIAIFVRHRFAKDFGLDLSCVASAKQDGGTDA